MEEINVTEFSNRLNTIEILLDKQDEVISGLTAQSYQVYLHLTSIIKQLIGNNTLDKNQLSLDMEELNELNAKMHKFSDPDTDEVSVETAPAA